MCIPFIWAKGFYLHVSHLCYFISTGHQLPIFENQSKLSNVEWINHGIVLSWSLWWHVHMNRYRYDIDTWHNFSTQIVVLTNSVRPSDSETFIHHNYIVSSVDRYISIQSIQIIYCLSHYSITHNWIQNLMIIQMGTFQYQPTITG